MLGKSRALAVSVQFVDDLLMASSLVVDVLGVDAFVSVSLGCSLRGLVGVSPMEPLVVGLLKSPFVGRLSVGRSLSASFSFFGSLLILVLGLCIF